MKKLVNCLKNNEKGFAPILVVILLVTGVLLGTYLVQNRTHILPFAEGDSFTCDSGNCDGQSISCKTTNDQGQSCDGHKFAVFDECLESQDDGTCTKATYHYSNDCREPYENCQENGSTGGEEENPKPGEGEQNASQNSCSAKNPNWISCTPEQSRNGYTVNNDDGSPRGYIIDGVCKRPIYFYEDKLSTQMDCCSVNLIVAANQDECMSDAKKTPGGTNGEVNIEDKSKDNSGGGQQQTPNQCPDNEMVFCQDGEKVRKHDGEMKDGNCEYQFENLGADAKCKNDDGSNNDGFVITPGKGTSGSGGEVVNSCKEEIEIGSYMNNTVLTKLIYYYAIIDNKHNGCVEADLGVPQERKAAPEDPQDGTDEQQLYLCNQEGELKWRTIGNSGDLVPAEGNIVKDRPSVEQYLESNITEAEKIVQIHYGNINYAKK